MSRLEKLHVFVCLLLTFGKEAFSQTKPSNAVAEIGGTVIFNCAGAQNPPNWFLSKDGTPTNQLTIAWNCNVNTNLQNHYKTEQIGGLSACNLIVFNVTMEQAGVYWCTESTPFYVLLTVIDSSPGIRVNNTSVMEKGNVIIECTLNHNGSVSTAPTLRPYFYWRNSNGQNVSSYNDITTETTAVSKLKVTAGRQDIMPYTCHVYLQLIPLSNPNYANNTPAVSNNASSPTIEVLYGPSIPVITSGSQIITIQGIACEVVVLTCNSTGNPKPSYEWFDTKENVIIINEGTMDLAEINRNYTCVAKNMIRNDVYHELSFHVQTSKTDVQDCRFPRKESTWINVTGCDNGTCSCSNGYDELNFTCNADSFPNASFEWIGADHRISNSNVYANITINGPYRCTAYFTQSTSNYTGNVLFTNGSNENNVTECSNEATTTPSNTIRTNLTPPRIEVIVPAVLVPIWVILNIILTSVFLIYYNGTDPIGKHEHKKILNNSFPWLKPMLPCFNESSDGGCSRCLWVFLFVLMSITVGFIVFTILLIRVNCKCCANCRCCAKDAKTSSTSTSTSQEIKLEFSHISDGGDEGAATSHEGQGTTRDHSQPSSEARRDPIPYEECSITTSPRSETHRKATKATKTKEKSTIPNYAKVNKTNQRTDDQVSDPYSVIDNPDDIDVSHKTFVPLPPIKPPHQTSAQNPNAPFYGELNFALQSNSRKPVQFMTEESDTQYAPLKKT